MTGRETIRNFSIIAHIDHGKSTLADRLIEATGGLTRREMTDQVLDSMDIERERGITIKAQTVRLTWTASDGISYVLNLMDTPGHVDFSYEVSRCLAACEGSLLLVDASQGVEAQTLANVYQALDADLEILPVLNKIDLDAADPQRTALQIEEVIGLDASDALHVSAKTGTGVQEVLEAIVTRLPPPAGDPHAPLKALLVDAYYDPYMGVVVIVRIVDGHLRAGDKIRMMQAGRAYEADQVGVFTPSLQTRSGLDAGEIGFFTASIKRVADCRIGDTIVSSVSKADVKPLAGFKPVQPVVFCGLFPTSSSQFEDLRSAMGKLALNDASFTFETESSSALGMGFRCGFLGLLHLEIIHERLVREFSLELVTTAPSVVYTVTTTDGACLAVHNPADMPERTCISAMHEPWIRATIYTPDECLGAVISLCIERRGIQKDLSYIGGRACLIVELPLTEVVFDFHDRLKSVSRGYASFDYAAIEPRAGDLVTMDIRINDEPVDALSILVHRSKAQARGRAMCQRLKDLIPRHMFKIPIQAAIGGRIISRETLPALRKDVTSKCYGGDITRKRKLLERQKEGKKKMRSIGKVNIPQQAFISALKTKDD